MQLDALTRLLALHPDVSDLLGFESLTTFCDIVCWLKDEISSIQRANIGTAPPILPNHVRNFIADALSLGYEDISRIWEVLRELAWAGTDLETDAVHKARRAQAILPLFLKYGPAHGVSFYTLRPPTRVCCDPGCSAKPVGRPAACSDGVEYAPRQLGEPLSHDIVVFTRDLGPLPATALSLYCRECNSRYYHNYYVHSSASTRTYYTGAIPDFVQITQHYYVAREVCEMFATLMNVSWTSATNCAKFYNLSMAKAEIDVLLPAEWKLTRSLTTEHVWDAFFTYSLLLDHHERGTILQLAHNATSHTERLRPALQARNALMVGPGQEQWSHACDLCCWVERNQDGQLSAVRSAVTDGVTIGHPCCGVHDCKRPLRRSKGARYCLIHASKEHECSVIDCALPAEGGFKTCAQAAHRAMDQHYHEKNSAMFQLQARLQRLGATSTHSKTLVPDVLELPNRTASPLRHPTLDSSPAASNPSISSHAPETTLEDDHEPPPAEAVCDAKSAEGNRRLHALFGRRRTHNEELCVTSCGVIIGRATFFGSEAVNGVIVCILATSIPHSSVAPTSPVA
ncbi:hypothetical protein VTO73DRAFT_13806 [Trametes versicolor]